MKNNSQLSLAKISANSNCVDAVLLKFSDENMKSVLEELVEGSVGVLRLGKGRCGLFMLFNNSQFTQHRLELNKAASWFLDRISTDHEGDPIKVYGNVLICNYTEDEPNALQNVDFNFLYDIFKFFDKDVAPWGEMYAHKFSIN